MANPQKENGYAPIANEILEALAQVNLKSYEWRVLMVVFRKTYGWHKKVDRLQRGQISKVTGLLKQNALKTLRSLKSRNMIFIKDGFISFNKDYETWKVEKVIRTDYFEDEKVIPTDYFEDEKVIRTDYQDPPKVIPGDYFDPYPETPKVIPGDSKVIPGDRKGNPVGAPQKIKDTTKDIKCALFEFFWKAYPRKVSKGAAYKSWIKIVNPEETLKLITEALAWQKASKEWREENGRYIPYPASYLNQQRWLDEKPPTRERRRSIWEMTDEELELWEKEERENGNNESGAFSH